MKPAIIFILSIGVLMAYGQDKHIKKCTFTTTAYYYKDNGKSSHTKRTDNYTIYNKQGLEIEYASYGEVSETYGKTDDGLAVIGDNWDNSKIFTNDFTTYDSSGKILRVDTWLYHDNIKSALFDYCVYKYNSNGLPAKETWYTEKDTIKKTTTYSYDKDLNTIQVIDSTFDGYMGMKLSELRTENKFDTLKRVVLTTEFSNGKFLLRKSFLYDGDNVTEMRYDGENDRSLWSITKTKIGKLTHSPYPKKVLEEAWEVIGSINTKKIFFYNADNLLEKIETYTGNELSEINKFSYKFY